MDADKRDEQFRERFIEWLADPDLLEVLLRENTGTCTGTLNRAIDLKTISKAIRNLLNKRIEAFRVAQEATTTRNYSEMDEMEQQLKEMTSAMNSVTNMVNQFFGAVVNTRRCGACGEDGHSADVCKQRMNASNLRGPGDHQRK